VRYLVDTHVWLWSLVEPDKLSRRARAVLSECPALIVRVFGS